MEIVDARINGSELFVLEKDALIDYRSLSFLAPGPSPSPREREARIARTRSLADWGVSSTAIRDSGPSALLMKSMRTARSAWA